MLIATVEWGSNKGDRRPEVIVGDSVHALRRRYVQIITGEVIDLLDLNDMPYSFLDDHPLPDLDDEQAVKEFCDAVREESTDAWLCMYAAPGDDRLNGITESEIFYDVRESE